MIIQIAYERLIEFYTSNNSNYSYNRDKRMEFGLPLCQNDEVDKNTKITYDKCKYKIDHLTIRNVKIKTKVLIITSIF